MLHSLLQFFKEKDEFSMTRLCCFLCVITALGIAICKPENLGLISLLLGFGLGAKISQKKMEN